MYDPTPVRFSLPSAESVARVRKAVVAGIGVGVMLANSALAEFAHYIPEDASKWVNVAVGFVTAVSVYLVKNADVIDNVGTRS